MTAAIANPSSIEVDDSHAGIIGRMQEVLVLFGSLPNISVLLKTPLGDTFPVFWDGHTHDALTEAQPTPESAGDGTFSFTLDDGSEVFICGATQNAATSRLVSIALQATLEALDARRREELLLEELGANWESLEALYEISTDALRSGDITDALKRLIERLAALQDGLHSALFIRRDKSFHPLVSTELVVNPLTSAELGPVERSMREMRVVLLNRLAQPPDERTCWREATSLAAAPFSWKGSVGFVVVWREDRDSEFDSSFCRVLEAITYQASVMMEGDRLHRKVRENELLAQEIDIASSIQQTLLLANAPKDVPLLELAACSVASRQIDGDFHDFFQQPDGTVDVLIGDVMGKGVAAALVGAATKSQFMRAIANLALRSKVGAPHPADIVTRAASRLSDRLISLDRFVTLCYARFDASTRRLTFVDCGHTSTIVESKSRPDCSFLRGADLPLGVLPDYRCEEQSVEFRAGDTYFFYSDGVTENRSPDGELFGTERLADCVQNWSSLGPTLLVEQIRKEAARFAGSENFSDDFTCIAVRIKINPSLQEPLIRRSTVFECDRTALDGFRVWLHRSVELAGSSLAEEDISRLQLACSEVFSNCVIHTREPLSGQCVSVECLGYLDNVIVRISHRGAAFDPLTVPPPSFDGSRDGGFGIFIVLRSADEASFSRTPDGMNVISLSFLRSTTDRTS